ncbi:hypothetical protein [Streptomyces sp. HNM0574]|uniref:hypothetical protein n=1 Tax=Streptomyces sp. HNM0574 TaxID=2714954 RepID=UPI00146E0218|nr:hypothetical protein [Streptomyces sp. HNM0574]NLU68333.1 hypothetical protein [Streptomyces sp. HNM0574]
MSSVELTPPEVARWARRAGVPLASGREADVAATAAHIADVIGVLRELDLDSTSPVAESLATASPAVVSPAEELADARV